MKFEKLLSRFKEVFPINWSQCVPDQPDNNKTDLRMMYDFIISTPKGCIVEVGVASGIHACYMGAAAREAGKMMYLIDPWGLEGGHHNWKTGKRGGTNQGPECRKVLRNVLNFSEFENYQCIRNFSEFAAPDFNEPISFIFIDGCHCSRCVKLDSDLWIPKIVDKGVVMYHDAGWETVQPVLIDYVNKWPGIEPVNMEVLTGNQSQAYIIHK